MNNYICANTSVRYNTFAERVNLHCALSEPLTLRRCDPFTKFDISLRIVAVASTLDHLPEGGFLEHPELI
jgi:hypothetical protein